MPSVRLGRCMNRVTCLKQPFSVFIQAQLQKHIKNTCKNV